MQLVAQSWLVLRLTDSGVALGMTLALQFAPTLVIGPWAGVIVDRIDKRRLLAMTTVVEGVLALVLGVVTVVGAVDVWMVYVLATLLGIVTAFDNPGRRAFVAELVAERDVANAVGLNSTVFTAARVVGPAVAAALIASVGVAWCFLVNAASYGAVLVALLAMRPSELRRTSPIAPGKRQLREGLRYVRANAPVLRALVTVAVVSTFAFNFQVVMPLFAERELAGGAATYGSLMAALGLGSLAGALGVAYAGRASGRALAVSAIVLGVALSATAAAPTQAVALGALPVVGAGMMVLLAMATAICNEEAAPAYRGRVMALFAVAFLGSTPIGGPLVGWISQTVGARAGLLVGAFAALATGTALIARSREPQSHEVPESVVPLPPEARAA
jgi:MFS family permease